MCKACGAKARQRAQAAANRRTGQAAAGAASNIAETLTGAGAQAGDLSGAYSSGYGGNGYIYAQTCPEGIDQDIALLATSAALAVGIYVVYRHATSFFKFLQH